MSARNPRETRRSSTGHYNLLPAFRPSSTTPILLVTRQHSLLTWTFGRGSVIWRIWPAVLLHTSFAAGIYASPPLKTMERIVTLTMRGVVDLKIPGVMLTVLGVVIGFVISYRAGSGYDRYWMGRTCWSDIIKNVRTLSRLIWFHVPLRLSPRAGTEVDASSARRTVGEMKIIMAEKYMALDLVEGLAVALKHHVRGELGIYYQDLYHLLKPFHDHEHSVADYRQPTIRNTSTKPPRSAHKRRTAPIPDYVPSPDGVLSPTSVAHAHFEDPVIPPINAYGTFNPSHPSTHGQTQRPSSSSASSSDGHLILLAPEQLPRNTSLLSKVSGDLIPFSGLLDGIRSLFSTRKDHPLPGPTYSALHTKHRPLAVDGGQNLPVAILRQISDWLSVLEDRGTVPGELTCPSLSPATTLTQLTGTSLGQMIGILASMEDNLSTLERILTTPLPFTVWIYLFFLPFQLVKDFGWYTIPGVGIAAFIYLGFVAAGEEIEQPFGYDENDLDLDLFCREIIHNEIRHLRSTPCTNAYLGPEIEDRPSNTIHRHATTLVEVADGHPDESS
ncbi:hypothetical protein NP233_g6772 [Leucocoprinus birnbaumii]|uniref:Uncharacterized protein n=1 Tax=Leucocoprinus birnbaumii TaxID=56174 RepID=A0AAD5YTD5_9AGAR|nr:hypothetical protein NP233_g6772 [Leucocoprinus birnbaumii]